MSITNFICIITFFISYQAFNNKELFHNLKHYPIAESTQKEWYRFVTSGFVHGSWVHLLINLYVLWAFGNILENLYVSQMGFLKGGLVYTALYLLTLIIADIPTYIKHKENPRYSSIGASGAVSGIMFALMLFLPWEWLMLYAIIPIPYIIGAIAYVVYSTWASKNKNDNIDHSAHLYGALFGIVFAIITIPNALKIFSIRIMEGPNWPPPMPGF